MSGIRSVSLEDFPKFELTSPIDLFWYCITRPMLCSETTSNVSLCNVVHFSCTICGFCTGYEKSGFELYLH